MAGVQIDTGRCPVKDGAEAREESCSDPLAVASAAAGLGLSRRLHRRPHHILICDFLLLAVVNRFISHSLPSFPDAKHAAKPSHPGMQEVWHAEEGRSGEDRNPDDGELDLPFWVFDIRASRDKIISASTGKKELTCIVAVGLESRGVRRSLTSVRGLNGGEKRRRKGLLSKG